MASLPNSATLDGSIWLLYALIVFEILFMISPVAAYYYAVYGLPLNWLADAPSTAWLTAHVLPHFAAHGSTLAHAAVAVAWPLILAGLVLFVLAFVQVYSARFTGKGAVVVGLYRYVRHPQYVALALVGLGTVLFWSRFIVIIAWVTMLFLYAALSANEESRCLARYGDAYRDYLQRTGRFLPRPVEAAFAPVAAWARGATWRTWIFSYLVVVAVAVGTGFAVKRHVATLLQTVPIADGVLLAVARTPDIERIGSLVRNDIDRLRPRSGDATWIAYLVPASWRIPELGLLPLGRYDVAARDELRNPHAHGNRSDAVDGNWQLLFATTDVVPDGRAVDATLLLRAHRVQPVFIATIANDVVTAVLESPAPGRWHDIPVPVY